MLKYKSIRKLNMSDTLIYLTESFPCGGLTEGVFVSSELDAISKKFNRIILMPLTRVGEDISTCLAKNVEINFSLTQSALQHNRFLKSFYLFHPFVIKELPYILRQTKNIRKIIKGCFNAINVLTISKEFKRAMAKMNLTPENSYIYTFWFENTAHALSYLCGKSGWRMSTRAHGHDIYDEAVEFRSEHIRNQALQHIEHVYCISQRGVDYLSDKFPTQKGRFKKLMLGSKRIYEPTKTQTLKGENSDEQIKYEKEEIRLLTVARISKEKRLNLALDFAASLAIHNPDINVEWELIGEGPLLSSLKQKADELTLNNLKVKFKGAQPNINIQKEISSDNNRWFILVSESEGIPISIGEAMSYGMPILATNVGGISELVTDHENGILIDKNFIPEDIAVKLAPILKDKTLIRKYGDAGMRKWENSFNSDMLSKITAETLREDAKVNTK